MLVTIGIAPTSKIASTVAIKLKAWVITSSPGLTPHAFRAILMAAVPEVTHKTYFVLKKFFKFFSKFRTLKIFFLLLSKP